MLEATNKTVCGCGKSGSRIGKAGGKRSSTTLHFVYHDCPGFQFMELVMELTKKKKHLNYAQFVYWNYDAKKWCEFLVKVSERYCHYHHYSCTHITALLTQVSMKRDRTQKGKCNWQIQPGLQKTPKANIPALPQTGTSELDLTDFMTVKEFAYLLSHLCPGNVYEKNSIFLTIYAWSGMVLIIQCELQWNWAAQGGSLGTLFWLVKWGNCDINIIEKD